MRLFFVALIIGIAMIPVFVFTENQNVGGNQAEIDALNAEIREKQAKIKEIEKTIEAYKKKIEQTQSQSVSLKNQLSILDTIKKQVELDLQATEQKVGKTELEVKELTLSIADAETKIKEQKILLAELIRVVYYENEKNYVQVLATNDTFSDFYGRVQQLRKVENDLALQAKTLGESKKELENKHKQMEDRKKILVSLQEELAQKKVSLNEQAVAKNQLLAQTQSSEKTYQTLVGSLKDQYRQIENEVSSIEQQIRRKLENQGKLDPIADDSSSLSWPTQSRYINAYFHDTSYPYRNVFEHSGIDIKAAQGTPVRASASGYVARAKKCTLASCYAFVLIVHQDGIATLYGHLSQINVSDEQFVTRGDVIGYSGATPGTVGAGPFTTGAHLHYEVRKNGIPVNPLNYLVKDW